MPSSRQSSSNNALQTINDNVQRVPDTPGKQVRTLKHDLEKKDAENSALHNTIAELTNALNGLNLVKEKIDYGKSHNVNITEKKGKKDKDAPVAFKTAYKFFSENTAKKEGVDMRQVWKDAAPEIRQVFINMAEADKARFQRESAIYEEEKAALEMYQEKKKQDQAKEFYEAHLNAQAAVEKAEADKKGKKKAKKDPEAPKRPTSSYMYFAMDRRDFAKKSDPTASPTQITTILAEMWNKLEKGKKGKKGTKRYDDMAAEDRVRYEADKAEYSAMIAEREAQAEQDKVEYHKVEKEEAMKLMKSFQEASAVITNDAKNLNPNMDEAPAISNVTANPKKKKDPNAPKHPTSAYLFFCTENRAKIKSTLPENASNKELLTEVGRQWKELTGDNKEKYTEMANKDKDRYTKEMVNYNAGKK